MNMTAWNTLLKITELGINMNTEKLDVLVSQAGFDVERLRAPHPGGFPREDMLALESLVELVVKECVWALWTEECRTSDLASEEYTRGSNKINNHFGVEA